ncbi:Uncharacterised protein [Vibrio cholerae]|nr:Uncharacterised protein [Vibrio cholerae]
MTRSHEKSISSGQRNPEPLRPSGCRKSAPLGYRGKPCPPEYLVSRYTE